MGGYCLRVNAVSHRRHTTHDFSPYKGYLPVYLSTSTNPRQSAELGDGSLPLPFGQKPALESITQQLKTKHRRTLPPTSNGLAQKMTLISPEVLIIPPACGFLRIGGTVPQSLLCFLQQKDSRLHGIRVSGLASPFPLYQLFEVSGTLRPCEPQHALKVPRPLPLRI